MQLRVLQQIMISGKIFPRGLHDFSDDQMESHEFKHFEKAGRIILPGAKSAKALENVEAAKAQRKAMEEKYAIPKPMGIVDALPEPKVDDEAEATPSPKKGKK